MRQHVLSKKCPTQFLSKTKRLNHAAVGIISKNKSQYHIQTPCAPANQLSRLHAESAVNVVSTLNLPIETGYSDQRQKRCDDEQHHGHDDGRDKLLNSEPHIIGLRLLNARFLVMYRVHGGIRDVLHQRLPVRLAHCHLVGRWRFGRVRVEVRERNVFVVGCRRDVAVRCVEELNLRMLKASRRRGGRAAMALWRRRCNNGRERRRARRRFIAVRYWGLYGRLGRQRWKWFWLWDAI